jgi:hypothetical protein
METPIKILLAMLFLICLANMPYGYYQLIRFLAMVGFGILAYQANQKDNLPVAIIYIVLAVLFQPIFKIALGRFLWNVVDIIVAVGLIISVFNNPTINNVDKKSKLK